jgi:hypothetical protein
MAEIDILLGKLATNAMFWSFLGVEPLPGLGEECQRNHSLQLLRDGYAACISVSLESLAEIRDVRIAIVAGRKQDSVEDTRAAGKVLGHENVDCKAFVVKDAIHWWDLQFPELFAQGVRAWVEGSEMPEKFEEPN